MLKNMLSSDLAVTDLPLISIRIKASIFFFDVSPFVIALRISFIPFSTHSQSMCVRVGMFHAKITHVATSNSPLIDVWPRSWFNWMVHVPLTVCNLSRNRFPSWVTVRTVNQHLQSSSFAALAARSVACILRDKTLTTPSPGHIKDHELKTIRLSAHKNRKIGRKTAQERPRAEGLTGQKSPSWHSGRRVQTTLPVAESVQGKSMFSRMGANVPDGSRRVPRIGREPA